MAMTYDRRVYDLVFVFMEDLERELGALDPDERFNVTDQICKDVQEQIEDGIEIARARFTRIRG